MAKNRKEAKERKERLMAREHRRTFQHLELVSCWDCGGPSTPFRKRRNCQTCGGDGEFPAWIHNQ